MRYNSSKCIFSFKIINISAPTILQDPLMTLYLACRVTCLDNIAIVARLAYLRNLYSTCCIRVYICAQSTLPQEKMLGYVSAQQTCSNREHVFMHVYRTCLHSAKTRV